MPNREPAHLALFVPDLRGGGVANVIVTLAGALADRGHRVDLVLCRASGRFLEQVPDSVKIVELRRAAWFLVDVARAAPRDLPALFLFSASSGRILETLPYLRSLTRYLRQQCPLALLAAKPQASLAAIWASRLAATATRVVTSDHVHLPSIFARRRGWRFLASAIRRNWRHADFRVTVSDGVADTLAAVTHMPREQIATIYNGVVGAELCRRAGEVIGHTWFQPNSPPVILSVARLEPQKDIALLLRAFAAVRKERLVRLVVLGEGPLRAELEALAGNLGIDDDVEMLGFVANPSSYMARSAVFVLSSIWEGFGIVITEALAAGCPVVSTDCPSGPAEILDGGAYGRLVPVGDVAALAEAIVATLDEPRCRERLQRRAQRFSTARMAEDYSCVLLDDPTQLERRT